MRPYPNLSSARKMGFDSRGFRDGRFGWKLSAAEAIDKDLAAIGACGRSRECTQLRLQFIRIIRQRIESRTFDNDLAGVVVGAGIDGVALLIDRDVLLFDCNGQGKVVLCGSTGGDHDTGLLERFKAGSSDGNGVGIGRQIL